VLGKIHADLSKVLLTPDVQQRMTEMVIEAAPTSREEFAAFMAAETKRWSQVAKGAGLTPQ
jgi:tripartite-type tricarboxylate transporter receptor subunit TctC